MKTNSELDYCNRCGFDTTISSIKFDTHGECNFCKSHDILLKYYPRDEKVLEKRRNEIVKKIKYSGRKRKYDCQSSKPNEMATK